MTFTVANTAIPGSAIIASELNTNFTDIGSELNLQTNKSNTIVELEQNRLFGNPVLSALMTSKMRGELNPNGPRTSNFIYPNKYILDVFDNEAFQNGSITNSCGSNIGSKTGMRTSFVYGFERMFENYSSGTIVNGGSGFGWRMFTQDWVTSISGLYSAGANAELRSSMAGSAIDLRTMPDNSIVMFRGFGAAGGTLSITSGVTTTDGAGINLYTMGVDDTVFIRTNPTAGSVFYSTNGGLIESGVNVAGTLIAGSWYILYIAPGGGGATLAPMYLNSGATITTNYQSYAFNTSGPIGNIIIGSINAIVDEMWNGGASAGSISYWFSANSGTTFQNIIPGKTSILNHSGLYGVFRTQFTTGSKAGDYGFYPSLIRKWMVTIK